MEFLFTLKNDYLNKVKFSLKFSELRLLQFHDVWKGLACLRMSAVFETTVQLWQRLNLIDTHEPSLRGVGLLEVSQLEIFQANYCLAHRIKAWLLVHTSANLTESIVAKPVHETVYHGF